MTGAEYKDQIWTVYICQPTKILAQLHDAALSSLAMSLVMFPCSLHTDSILKMYLHPI